jgi:hypothetical protein
VQELLGDLLECEPEGQDESWLRILRVAPELWRSRAAQQTLVTVVPAAVKSRLGLRA